MRKDFLTDPYQVLEARAAGAGGVLVIVAMLDDATVRALVECARRCGMFVLLEAFDRADLERRRAVRSLRSASGAPLLAGVNCRDLRDLAVRFGRFAELAPICRGTCPRSPRAASAAPPKSSAVAAGRVSPRPRRLGADALRGPGAALADLLAAGRAALTGSQRRCS